MKMRPPTWLPYLGPLLAALVGIIVGQILLGGGFWTVFLTALVFGFAPIIGYRIWKRLHHRR